MKLRTRTNKRIDAKPYVGVRTALFKDEDPEPWNQRGRIEDVEMAHAMALAGEATGERTTAAMHRAVGKYLFELGRASDSAHFVREREAIDKTARGRVESELGILNADTANGVYDGRDYDKEFKKRVLNTAIDEIDHNTNEGYDTRAAFSYNGFLDIDADAKAYSAELDAARKYYEEQNASNDTQGQQQ